MRIERIVFTHFRNLTELLFEPSNGVNIIYGENAQGKTNLIEGIWMLSGAKSFRGAADSQLIEFEEENARLEASFFAGGRGQTVRIQWGQQKGVFLNEIPLSSVRALSETVKCVVFSPDFLSLVKDGPNVRRKFLDQAICQLYPRFRRMLNDYNHALSQRISLIRDIWKNRSLEELLPEWDEVIARIGAPIVATRIKYIQRLNDAASEVYKDISKGREYLILRYETPASGCIEKAPTVQQLMDRLSVTREEDIRQGATTVGPHRDDLAIEINGHAARSFASQGQQRSCALSLKLAECKILTEVFEEPPLILLDDVMSELDESRREYILQKITGQQVFITCCDPKDLMGTKGLFCVRMKEGKIID